MFETLRARQLGASLPSLLFYKLARLCSKLYFRCCHAMRVAGVERVPATGPCIFASNHQSFYDPPAIAAALWVRHVDFIARAGLFTFKPFGWFIAALSAIPIRGGPSDTGSIREVVTRLQQGRATLIFPEGSRSPDGLMHPMQRGVLLLVRKAKCPVVPVAIDGAFRAWPRHRAAPVPFSAKIQIQFGQPIPAAELAALDPDAAMQLIQLRIATLLAQMRGVPIQQVLSSTSSETRS
jgi:1-acyl-sn-glycerol-3-phosphate acyltransferase